MNFLSRITKPWSDTSTYEWVESGELRFNQLFGTDLRWRSPAEPPTRTELPVLDDCFGPNEASVALDFLVTYKEEFSRLPTALSVNCYFGPADAAFYWSFIRLRRPAKVVEIGSGYSSRVARRALEMNGEGRLICIDPAPRLNLPGNKLTHVKAKVEEIGVEFFLQLGPRDILFIDSSHTDDEVRGHLRVLERLPTGILVHYHDIDYPWKRQDLDWKEDRVVAEFLESHDNWRVIVSGSVLSRDYLPRLRETIPSYRYCPYRRYNALWMTRVI